MTQTLTKLRVNKQEAASLMSCCERTVDSIPEDLLPRRRLGRAVGFRVVDIEALLRRVACGEVTIGKVNN